MFVHNLTPFLMPWQNGSCHASFSHKKHLGPSCHRFLFTTGCSSFLFCACQALRRFFIPFRVGISEQEFPRLIQSQDMKRRKKKHIFCCLLRPACYCKEMLVVLSIVLTKAAFCLMTNEQTKCFPETWNSGHAMGTLASWFWKPHIFCRRHTQVLCDGAWVVLRFLSAHYSKKVTKQGWHTINVISLDAF